VIYDFFIITDELDLAEIRINYLNPVVDRFVVTESDRTFTGKQREYQFQSFMEKLDPFTCAKVRYLRLKDVATPDVWLNERITRNAALHHMASLLTPQDILMYSDVDEIPRKEAILSYNGFGPQVMHQHYLYYKVNWMVQHPQPWPGTIITDAKYVELGEPNTVGSENLYFQGLRNRRDNLVSIENGGFHFSYCLPIEKIRNKISSFAHAAILDTPAINNEEHIKACMEKGESLNCEGECGDHIKINKVPIETLDLPRYLLDNREKFSYMFE